MIRDTIQKIEARLQSAENLPPEKRAELLALLKDLKTEVGELSQTNSDQAQSIAGFAQVVTHEATRSEPQPQLLEHSLAGFSDSVKGFEQSHPRLVQVVNTICTTMSNLGI